MAVLRGIGAAGLLAGAVAAGDACFPQLGLVGATKLALPCTDLCPLRMAVP